MKKIWVPLAIIACVYLSLCGALFFFQRDLLYLPPAIHEHNYPSKSFSNESERIDVITLNTQHKKAILYFGGNSEAVVKNASTYIRNFPNHAIYLVNYRGYGSSTGQPTEAGIYSDALHIFDEIKSQHTTISIIGRSLGSGVATYVAANRNVEKLILITPYDSIESIAAAQYPIFPVSLLLLDKYHSDDRAKNIRAKTLILLAENDKVIPLVSSQRLIKQFNKALLTIKTIKNADHRNISSFDEYNVLMEEFMVFGLQQPYSGYRFEALPAFALAYMIGYPPTSAGSNLHQAVRPLVSNATEKAGVTSAYKQLVGQTQGSLE